jgi:hypothetical protein
MARPKLEIDWGKLDGLLFYDAPLHLCADELGVSHDCLEGRIKSEKGMTFGEYKKMKLAKTAIRLKQKMIQKALAGDNTCLIFTLKNIGDWADRVETVGTDDQTKTVVLKYKLEKLPSDEEQP